MKHVLRWLLSAVIVAGWFGCQKDPLPVDGPEGRASKFSIQEARSVYESQAEAQTRSNRRGGILDPGEIFPYWEGADYSENSMIAGYDVGIVVDHYFEFLQPTPDGRFRAREMFPRLVSLSTIDRSRQPVALIAYYLTDLPQTSLEEEDPGKDLLNCEPKVGFTGRILYTTLDGHPVAISQHIQGEQVNEAYLWNATDSVSLQNLCDRFNDIAQGIYIRSEEAPHNTRTIYDWYLDEDGNIIIIEIEAVECVARPGLEGIDIPMGIDIREFQITDPTTGGGNSGGGSGGGSAGEGEDSSQSEHNAKISSESDVVHDLLDSLMKDCMGQKLIQAIDMEVTIVVETSQNGADFKTGTIHFEDGGANGKHRIYVLIEELIHMYQYQRLGSETYSQGALNREVEAKVGWLLYERRMNNGILPEGSYSNQLGGKFGDDIFWGLINNCYPDFDNTNALHQFYYESAINSLRKYDSYKDTTKYLESEEYRDFENIKELSKDCEQ